MAAFAVISTGPSTKTASLEAAVKAVYPTSFQVLSDTVWLVSDLKITTQGVCTKLGISDGALDSAVVIKVDSYWGRASKTVWEWLAVNGSTE